MPDKDLFQDLLTTTQTARELQKSEQTTRNYGDSGVLDSVRGPNGQRFYSKRSVERLKAQLQEQALRLSDKRKR